MSVTPLHYSPALPPVGAPDRAHGVIDLLPVYIELAGRVAATEFVPKALRNRPEAVLAALMSGAERGFGPMESLRSVHIIEGTPTLSAEAKRALVLAAGHTFEVLESSAVKCTCLGRRLGSETTTTFTWTMDRARRARLASKDNWVKYPESMLLARATSELCNAMFPDVTAGLATTEVVADEAAPIPTTSHRRAPARRLPAPAPAPAPEIAPAVETSKGEASAQTAGAPIDVDEGQADDELDTIPGSDQPTWGTPAPDTPAAQPHDPTLAKRIHAEVAKAFPMADANTPTRDRWRHALCAVVTRRRPDGPATSSSDLDLEEQLALSELLVRIQGGQATVADGPDDTIELRAGGGWRYTISLEPPTVTVHRGDIGGGDSTPDEATEETR